MYARAHSTICSRKTHRSVWSGLQFIIVALALAVPCAATAQTPDPAASDVAANSSDQKPSQGFHFDPDKLDLNIYGLAYHPDRDKVHKENLDNQVNPGLGLHYDFHDTKRGVAFAEIGAYYDSGSNWAKFLSLGYQLKLGENWKFGGAVAAMHSDTYNQGVSFVGMFPLVTYELGPIKLNAVYFPRVANYNEVAAFGFYISVPLGRWIGGSGEKQ